MESGLRWWPTSEGGRAQMVTGLRWVSGKKIAVEILVLVMQFSFNSVKLHIYSFITYFISLFGIGDVFVCFAIVF